MSSLLTTRLGAVPTRVIIPLISAATLIGIIRRLADIPLMCAMRSATGMKMAMTPVELMIDPSNPTANMSRISRRVSLVPAVTASQSPSFWATPVLTRPSPITNNTAMSTMLESLNPAIASPMVITPVKGNNTIMMSATASMRGLLITNITTEATSRVRTTRSSVFISDGDRRKTLPQTLRRPGPIPLNMGIGPTITTSLPATFFRLW